MMAPELDTYFHQVRIEPYCFPCAKDQLLQLAVPTGEPGSGLTIVVGEKMSGKSELLYGVRHKKYPFDFSERQRMRAKIIVENLDISPGILEYGEAFPVITVDCLELLLRGRRTYEDTVGNWAKYTQVLAVTYSPLMIKPSYVKAGCKVNRLNITEDGTTITPIDPIHLGDLESIEKFVFQGIDSL